MSFRQLLVILAVLSVGRLCFSAETESKQNQKSADQLADHSAISQLDYVLQPSDLIRIVIFQEPDLEREVRLSADSKISLPLINEVNLKDKTIAQAQEIIHNLYNQEYLVNPQINVTVLDYTKQTVNVLGAVGNPGAVDIPPDRPLNLIDAITRAGGFSRLADRKRVRITRETEDHRTTSNVVNADDIMHSTNSDQQRLRKGDVIYVPERIL
jgi:polysaccharide export outer membrane protein